MSPFRPKLLKVPPYILALLFGTLASYGVVDGGMWGAAGIGGAALLALVIGVGQGRLPMPSGGAVTFVVLGLGAAALSAQQSIDPDRSWHVTYKMASIFIPLVFLSAHSFRLQGAALIERSEKWAFILAVSLLVMSVGLAATYNMLGYDALVAPRFNRGFSYNAMMVWPLLALLFVVQKKRVLGALLLAAFVIALLFTHSRASQLGIFLALGVFVLASYLPRLTEWAVKLGTVLLFIAPWFAGKFFAFWQASGIAAPVSWRHRLEIWDNFSFKLSEAPIFGHGIGASEKIAISSPNEAFYQLMSGPAAHPHNAAMQLWLETGVLGVVFGLYTCFWALKGVKSLSNNLKPYGCAAYMVGLTLSMLAYNLWTDSLWSAYALTAFCFWLLSAEKARN